MVAAVTTAGLQLVGLEVELSLAEVLLVVFVPPVGNPVGVVLGELCIDGGVDAGALGSLLFVSVSAGM